MPRPVMIRVIFIFFELWIYFFIIISIYKNKKTSLNETNMVFDKKKLKKRNCKNN